MKPEETVDFHLRATWQSLVRMYNEIAADYGGTMASGFLLLQIEPTGTPSTALGPRMGMEATSMSRTLKSLEDKGLIAKRRSPEDKRMVYIHLTNEGQIMRDKAREAVLHFNNVVREKIAPERLHLFFETAKALVRIIETEKKQLVYAQQNH